MEEADDADRGGADAVRRFPVSLAAMLAMAATAAADPLETAMGRALFARNWVAAPASTDASSSPHAAYLGAL